MNQTKTILSFNKPTPAWATWVFRIVFLLTTATTIVVAADPDIKDKTKVKLGVYLKALDFVIWGVGRGLGVDRRDFEEQAKEEEHG